MKPGDVYKADGHYKLVLEVTDDAVITASVQFKDCDQWSKSVANKWKRSDDGQDRRVDGEQVGGLQAGDFQVGP